MIFIIGFFYFLPTIEAVWSRKRNAGAIFLLNLLLGWTVLGWIIAAVWASTVEVPTAAPVVQIAKFKLGKP